MELWESGNSCTNPEILVYKKWVRVVTFTEWEEKKRTGFVCLFGRYSIIETYLLYLLILRSLLDI